MPPGGTLALPEVQTSGADVSYTQDPVVGQTLPGGYTVEKGIGAGAFARVYLGRTGRKEPVAIKILHEPSPEARNLFTREVKIMRALPPSPNRVRHMGDGTTPDGRPFLVMEYVEGGNLRQVIRERGAYSVDEACKVMLELCDAFADLHQLGVVHRDLKPDNLLLTRDGRIKLSDFGLVKDAQGLLQLFESEDILKGRDFSNQFDARLMMGTPEYMAPEQFLDPMLEDQDQARTDTWTDVYSLGLVFYAMLSGRKLWVMKGSAASGADSARSLAEFIRYRTDPRADSEVVRPPNVPEGLWDIITRTLRQDPKRRHHNAAELARDIRTWMRTGRADDTFDDAATSAADMREMLKAVRGANAEFPSSSKRPNAPAARVRATPPPPPVATRTHVSTPKLDPARAAEADAFSDDATSHVDVAAILKQQSTTRASTIPPKRSPVLLITLAVVAIAIGITTALLLR